MVSSDGLPNVVRRGNDHTPWGDVYHLLLTIPWPGFLALVCALYIAANALFAVLYMLDGDGIANGKPGSFGDAFFFSVQTMASLGYGHLHPQSTYVDAIVTLESLVGLLGLATGTGIVFARVSRPTARVVFSNVAVVAPYNGVPTLMFRVRNQRRNQILEAQMVFTLLRREVSLEGQTMYRFCTLKLVRSRSPIFALTWTLMHPIDESSPLHGLSREDLDRVEAEFVMTLTGLDETFAQTIHARHSYLPCEVHWNHCFADVFSYAPDGRRLVDYRCFHDIVPLAAPALPLTSGQSQPQAR